MVKYAALNLGKKIITGDNFSKLYSKVIGTGPGSSSAKSKKTFIKWANNNGYKLSAFNQGEGAGKLRKLKFDTKKGSTNFEGLFNKHVALMKAEGKSLRTTKKTPEEIAKSRTETIRRYNLSEKGKANEARRKARDVKKGMAPRQFPGADVGERARGDFKWDVWRDLERASRTEKENVFLLSKKPKTWNRTNAKKAIFKVDDKIVTWDNFLPKNKQQLNTLYIPHEQQQFLRDFEVLKGQGGMKLSALVRKKLERNWDKLSEAQKKQYELTPDHVLFSLGFKRSRGETTWMPTALHHYDDIGKLRTDLTVSADNVWLNQGRNPSTDELVNTMRKALINREGSPGELRTLAKEYDSMLTERGIKEVINKQTYGKNKTFVQILQEISDSAKLGREMGPTITKLKAGIDPRTGLTLPKRSPLLKEKGGRVEYGDGTGPAGVQPIANPKTDFDTVVRQMQDTTGLGLADAILEVMKDRAMAVPLKNRNNYSSGGSVTKGGQFGLDVTNKVGAVESLLAGIASGLIDIPKGAFTLGASLLDLGFGTSNAAKVERYFDDLTGLDEKEEATRHNQAARRISAAKIVVAIFAEGSPCLIDQGSPRQMRHEAMFRNITQESTRSG